MVLVFVLCFVAISWGKDSASFCYSECCPRYRVAVISNGAGMLHINRKIVNPCHCVTLGTVWCQYSFILLKLE